MILALLVGDAEAGGDFSGDHFGNLVFGNCIPQLVHKAKEDCALDELAEPKVFLI